MPMTRAKGSAQQVHTESLLGELPDDFILKALHEVWRTQPQRSSSVTRLASFSSVLTRGLPQSPVRNLHSHEYVTPDS